MALRQRKWARKATVALRLSLGGKCAHCRTTEKLTFDLVIPYDAGRHHKMEYSWRVSFYRIEARHGNLQILCEKCNARKGNKQ